MNIIFGYPLWYIIGCMLLSGVYTFFMYYKNIQNSEIPSRLIKVLAALRFISVFIIALFILEPVIKSITREKEFPKLIVLQDVSESVTKNSDSTIISNVTTQINLLEKSNDNLNVISHYFGENVNNEKKPQKITNISKALNYVDEAYNGQNISGLVLISDGIYNQGLNPTSSVTNSKYPIHTIALGNPEIPKDIWIKEVNHNQVAYLKNKFQVGITISANQLKGRKGRVSVIRKGKVLVEKQISIADNDFQELYLFELTAGVVGVQKYDVKISGIDDENQTNNFSSFYIDILDGRNKVVIIANAPHPDINAIKSTLTKNENYEVDVNYLNTPIKYSKYNLAIFHNLPSNKNDITKEIKAFEDRKIPTWMILGLPTNFNKFNSLNKGFKLSNYIGAKTDAQLVLNNKFDYFQIEDVDNRLLNTPPVAVPFGEFTFTSKKSDLFYQKIGAIETQEPLGFFFDNDGVKEAYFVGEGIWRTRLAEYAQYENSDFFESIIQKTVQYLASKENKNLFRVSSNNAFWENEKVNIEAELYNKNYELYNEPEVSITLIGQDNKKYSYQFSRTEKAYQLNINGLPIGNYSYIATTKAFRKTLKETGEITIKELQLENQNLVANHNLLMNLSKITGGLFFNANQMKQLNSINENNNQFKTIIHTFDSFDDLIEKKWIFFLILFLLAAEWFLRKRYGLY